MNIPGRSLSRSVSGLVVLALSAVMTAAAADYGPLAGKVSKAGAGHGISRYAIAEFTAASGATQEEADAAKSALAQELAAQPNTGAMDVKVLAPLGRAKYWPQAQVDGTLYGTGAERSLVLKVTDRRGLRIGIFQINFPAGEPAPSDLRDAPANASPCERLRGDLLRQNRELVDIKARYWAEKARSPGFDHRSLAAAPGSELKEYDVTQKFYSLVNAYYDQDEPVTVSAPEKATLEKLLGREKTYETECGGSAGADAAR